MVDIKFKQAHKTNYAKGRDSEIEWIVLHYTANKGDTAENNAKYFSREQSRAASAHYFVDENEIWQAVKDEDTAYAVGAKKYYNECRNTNSISIEMCNSMEFVNEKVYTNTVDLTVYLMEKYGIGADHVVRHFDVTHKSCPAPWVKSSYDWACFKNDIRRRKEEDERMTQEEFNEMLAVALSEMRKKDEPSWAKKEGVIANAKSQGISDGTAPQGFITRVEAMAMILRALNKN